MRKAYSYVRFSTPEQLKGDSLRRQKKLSEDYCKRHDLLLEELPPVLGKSAHKGKHRKGGTALGDFLKAIEIKEITDAVLIVESLDRLTREQVRTAVKFFIGILDSGIDIITLNPEYVFKANGNTDMQDIMMAVVMLCRGYEESATKGKRIKEVWGKRRENLYRTKENKRSGLCPAWMTLNTDKTEYVIDTEKAATVKQIFQWAIDGFGVYRITRKLNQSKTPLLSSKKRECKQWYESYVIRILNSRSVLGEFQPCIRTETNKSEPMGDVIMEYYPAIITQADFDRARQAIDSRALGFKRTGKDCPNLFTKLIKDARDMTGFIYIPKKKRSKDSKLISNGAKCGSSLPLSFPYEVVEQSFLQFLKEIKPHDIKTSQLNTTTEKENEGLIAALDKRMKELKEAISNSDNLKGLLVTYEELAVQRKALIAKNDELRTDRLLSDKSVLDDTTSLLELLQTTTDETELLELRTRLRQQIRRVVSEMYLLVYQMKVPAKRTGRSKKVRCAILQVHFRNGNWRSIDMCVESTEAFNVENKGTHGDLRQYSQSAKQLDAPIWYSDYPALEAF